MTRALNCNVSECPFQLIYYMHASKTDIEYIYLKQNSRPIIFFFPFYVIKVIMNPYFNKNNLFSWDHFVNKHFFFCCAKNPFLLSGFMTLSESSWALFDGLELPVSICCPHRPHVCAPLYWVNQNDSICHVSAHSSHKKPLSSCVKHGSDQQ